MSLLSSILRTAPQAAPHASSVPTSGPTTDALFRQVTEWQGDLPWGHTLDAGTGSHSLRWLRRLRSTQLTAVTADAQRQQSLRAQHDLALRPRDRIVVGDWADPDFLADQRFDTVLADYLLGAIDGFAPYLQDRLFARLRPLVGGRLYAIGQEPLPLDEGSLTEAQRVVSDIARLRDACILLAGHRCYREYPRAWVERSLTASGLVVKHAMSVPIVYGHRFVNGQLDVCKRKLALIPDARLSAGLDGRINDLRAHALATHDRLGGLACGSDWIVCATPT